MGVQSQTTRKGEIVKEPEILLQEFFQLSGARISCDDPVTGWRGYSVGILFRNGRKGEGCWGMVGPVLPER